MTDKEPRLEMFRMLAHEVKQTGCVSASVGGHVDHVHLLTGLSRTITIAKLVEQIKTKTSTWAKENFGPVFQWQTGYGAFSVSHSLKDKVDGYIRNQEEHHETRNFKDEFRLLCGRHGVRIDENYVWD